ncbi:hypothetical protein ZTR_02055 [Talaromyces verruculosus]|nr:hypothetical protein ZTR_02055 [Talaromyces verruculosus]
MSLNILVVGAGVSGPAFAMLLQRSNPKHKITILERSPTIRLGGQQIDLKNQGPHILRQMGLLDEIKAKCVDETGLEVVDSKDKTIARFCVAPAGQRRPGLTSEHEILRGDMVQVLYDASIRQNQSMKAQSEDPDAGLRYVFGQTIVALDQRENDNVDVTFSNGEKKRYDLVVAADGQWSHTRRLSFGEETSKAAFRTLGIHAAYFSLPRIENEATLARAHLAPGRRMIFTRTSGRPVTGALLFTMQKSEKLSGCYRESIEKQKEAFAEAFRDIDWQADRLTSGLKSSSDFYAHELCQIKMKELSTGHVVLLGDAGYCPTPFTGLGTNLCLVGSYILAGELARHGRSNISAALRSYDEKMRPFIDECQSISPTTLSLFFPSSRLGIWAMHSLAWAVASFSERFWQGQEKLKDHHAEKLPMYPELNLPW